MMGTSLWHEGGSLVWGDRRTRKTSGPPPGVQRRACAGVGPGCGGSWCGPLSAAGALRGHAAKSVRMGVSTVRRLGRRMPSYLTVMHPRGSICWRKRWMHASAGRVRRFHPALLRFVKRNVTCPSASVSQRLLVRAIREM